MKTKELPVSYLMAEGFRVGYAKCRKDMGGCGHEWTAALHPDTDCNKLRCPKCKNKNNLFVDI